MGYHYQYGGSTAKRTLNCPGWKALTATLPEQDTSSSYADEGTVCHEACEKLGLNEDLAYEDLLNLNIKCNDAVLTEDLLEDKVIPAFEAYEDLLDEFKLEFTEAELQVEHDESTGGTVDLVAWTDDVLFIGDYKFGDGNMVYAEHNEQMMFYAWCLLTDDKLKDIPRPEKILLSIIQPSDRRDEITDVWETSYDEIIDFGASFIGARRIAAQSNPGENLHSGDHCKFCPAAAVCPQKTGQAAAALRIDTGDHDELQERLVEALELAEQLTPWIKEVFAFAEHQDELGVKIAGWKRVDKRATRKWIDEEAAEKYLKRTLKAANAMKSKVISPAESEKVAKKLGVTINIDKFVVKKSSGTTLVRESDKRPAVLSEKAIAESLKSIA